MTVEVSIHILSRLPDVDAKLDTLEGADLQFNLKRLTTDIAGALPALQSVKEGFEARQKPAPTLFGSYYMVDQDRLAAHRKEMLREALVQTMNEQLDYNDMPNVRVTLEDLDERYEQTAEWYRSLNLRDFSDEYMRAKMAKLMDDKEAAK